jgi:hypothetical protein
MNGASAGDHGPFLRPIRTPTAMPTAYPTAMPMQSAKIASFIARLP